MHQHRSSKKIIIGTITTLHKIISSNYLGPVDLIWDSFLLKEKSQMLKGKVSPFNAFNEEQKECDILEKFDGIASEVDLFSLLKLHKPLVDYYCSLLMDNNGDSRLFLFDSRLADFYGIEKSLGMNLIELQMWHTNEEYASDLQLAGDYFQSKELDRKVVFDKNEAKEIITVCFFDARQGNIHTHGMITSTRVWMIFYQGKRIY
ncbi:MAG: hypothetical protein IPP71_10025 [Bacteroidetes bacterium]|nr:hypothetical protein [Bacteroidota bacterium]